MAKLTDIKYVISASGRREEISLYTTKEEAGDICKGFKLPDGTKAYAAIGDTKSRLATMKRFKIQGKVYAALTEAEKKKTKVKKVYIFKAGSHRFKVPFWAKKVHYTLCGGGNGIISTNAPILDTIEKDGITDNKSIMMARKVNDVMYATIPYMGRSIMGTPSSMYVEKEFEGDPDSGYETYTGTDETRSINTASRVYNNWRGDESSWIMQTTDNKSKGFSVYQADASVYNNMGQHIETTPVVTRKKVVIAPTMINPDIVDDTNYDNLVDSILVGLPLPPPMGPVENEGEYVRLTAIKDDASFTVYNKGFKALYNVYPKSDMVKITDISKFINDTMAKYKVNLVDKDIYHDEDNSLMVNSFINQAYIYNTYTPFDKLYSAGIAMYNDGSTPPSRTDSLIQSTYDTAFNQFKAKSTEYKQRYDNVTYYMRKQFLNGTMFDYDYMMQLKEAGTLDNMINSSMLSNMDLVDGAYDFATGHHTSPKLSETRLGAKEVIFDIQCLDGVVRPLSIKYGGSLVLGWDKYFDDAYCYDIEDIDIYRAEEFTKLFNPLSGNIVPNPLEGQEITGTWDVSPDEDIVIEVGTHGKLYTEDMGFKLNKYFHDRDADGICILEVEGDFEDIDDIDNYINDNIRSLTPDHYNQMVMLDPISRDMYQRYLKYINNYSGDIDLSAQDTFTVKRSAASPAFVSNLKLVDGMATDKNINLYYSSRTQKVESLPKSSDYTIKVFGYDIGKTTDLSLFHNYIGAYDGVKMDIAEDLISNLSEYVNYSGNVYQSVIPVRNYYADKEHTFIFKNANTISYAFMLGVIDSGHTPKVKLNYNKALDVTGALIFTNTQELDYRWYVSLGLYINPSTAKNINVNERMTISFPNENAIKNKKVKIFKPWATYDQSKAYVKYIVPKDYTAKSIIGIVPLLDKSIDNVYIDITNLKDEPYTISPIVSSTLNKLPNVHIIDNSGIAERKFNGLFGYAKKNYLGAVTLAPTVMDNFARSSSADLSDVILKTSTIKSFAHAFNEFSGKFPKNIDLTSGSNFESLFYNTNLDNITMDSFVDSTYVATTRESDRLTMSSMFTTFTGRDISFDVWGFLVKKVKLLEKLKSYAYVNLYSMLTYVRSIPFFSFYEIYMAVADEKFYNLSARGNLGINGIANTATFKELEMPILTDSNGQLNRKFSLDACNTNGIGKLVFRQPPNQNIASIDSLKVSITDIRYCGDFITKNKPESNTYKLPTTIVVRLLRDKTSIPETTESIEAIKTFLNATYATPKENISVIFE
jgi:hypothetical protein|nr:MAG TPA: hypothetical protein [Caudoviricetes sp.]